MMARFRSLIQHFQWNKVLDHRGTKCIFVADIARTIPRISSAPGEKVWLEAGNVVVDGLQLGKSLILARRRHLN